MSGLINDPNLSLLVKFDVIANDVITEHVKPGSTVMEETPADQIEVKVDHSDTKVDSLLNILIELDIHLPILLLSLPFEGLPVLPCKLQVRQNGLDDVHSLGGGLPVVPDACMPLKINNELNLNIVFFFHISEVPVGEVHGKVAALVGHLLPVPHQHEHEHYARV